MARAISERKGWKNLPGTLREVKEVAALYPVGQTDVLTGEDASEERIVAMNRRGELGRYPYLLFATHGYLSSDDPNLSSVVLSQVNLSAESDGYITAAEWAGFSLNSELVVLSGCETGAGRIVAGEGVVGLPYALALAGAKRAVVTLWPVLDEPGAKFVKEFFKKMQEGRPISEALSATKREFLRDPVLKTSAIWAPFLLYGK